MLEKVYYATNLINGKQYIGDHSTSDIEKDKYFGSGIAIKAAVKKYGLNNFKKEIIKICKSKQEPFNYNF